MPVILYDPSQDHEWPEIDRRKSNQKCQRKKYSESNTSLPRIHRPSTSKVLTVHTDSVKRAGQLLRQRLGVIRSAVGRFS
jgi:hypothetical protein